MKKMVRCFSRYMFQAKNEKCLIPHSVEISFHQRTFLTNVIHIYGIPIDVFMTYFNFIIVIKEKYTESALLKITNNRF